MRWSKRDYYLDGKFIDSSKVSGALHTRRRNIETSCMACHDPVIKGQKYVMLYVLGADPIHFDCIHRPIILATKTVRAKYMGSTGIRVGRTKVYCEEFTINSDNIGNETK